MCCIINYTRNLYHVNSCKGIEKQQKVEWKDINNKRLIGLSWNRKSLLCVVQNCWIFFSIDQQLLRNLLE